MKKYLSLFLFAASLAFFSCGDDEPIVPSATTKADTPYSLIGDDAMVYAGRREVPAISDPSMFVVHYYTNSEGNVVINYCLEWDKELRCQRWSAYYINASNNKKSYDRSSWRNGAQWKGQWWNSDPFQEDSIIPAAFRTTLADHWNNGYDRGHIVNSNDRLCSQSANGQTFYLSNVHPQRSDFNGSAPGGGIWLNFENRVNAWGKALRGNEYLFIVKGGSTRKTDLVTKPFIDDARCNIPVPAYFFMAVLKYNSDNTYQAIGFWAKHERNQDTNVKAYTKSIDELESLTGIDFYHNLDDAIENAVEKSKDLNKWIWAS